MNGMGAPGGRGDIVVAGQQDGHDAGLGELHDALVPFALESRGRGAIFISIPGENHQVHLFLNCSLDDLIH